MNRSPVTVSWCCVLAGLMAGARTQDTPQDAAVPIADTGLHCVLPKGYRVVTPPAGALFLAQGPAAPDSRPSVAISPGPMVFPLGTNVELRDALVALLEPTLPGFQVIDDGRRPVLGRPTWWLRCSFHRGEDELRQLMVLLPGWPCYWCTFTVSAGAYDTAVTGFEQLLQSLQRRGPSPAPGGADVELEFADGRVTLAGLGLELSPPAGWRPVPAVLTRGALFGCAGAASGGVAPNLTVQLRPAGAPADVAAVRRELQGAERSGLRVLECLVVELCGRRVVRSLVEFGAPGRRLVAQQYVVPGAPHGLLLTYTMPLGEAQRLLPLVEASADSLVLGPSSR